jgi:aminoglycoside 3-N-acetyltransferase
MKLFNPILFNNSNSDVDLASLKNCLSDLIDPKFDILYIHSGINFGSLGPNLNRIQLFELLIQVFLDSTKATLVFPTYSFSYCNHENYDSKTTKSKMGTFSEYVRTLPFAKTSIDPLMSHAIIRGDDSLLSENCDSSFGNGSTFDKLSKSKNVAFLFFGVEAGECFTFMHYLEKIAGVSYRVEKKFSGLKLDNETGKLEKDVHSLYVRKNNIIPTSGSFEYQKELQKRKFLVVKQMGLSSVSLVEKNQSTEVFNEILGKFPNFFIQYMTTENDLKSEFFQNKVVKSL